MLSAFVFSLAFCAVSEAPATVAVGDDQLRVQLTTNADGTIDESCLIAGVEFQYSGIPAAVQLDGEIWIDLDTGTMVSNGPNVVLEGKLPGLSWRLTYECTGPGRVSKHLVIKSVHDVVLTRVAMASFSSQTAPDIVSTGLQDIAAFVRNGDRGIFVSLDFPYSRITTEDGLTRVTFPAFEKLSEDSPFTCHTLTIGATQHSGETRYGRDTGEVDAMDAYIQGRYPQRFDMPMFVSACINNRYTMPREGMVWYSYKDHPTLSFNLDLMKRELDLMPQLGMQYYQVFPGIFDWAPDDPNRDAVKEIVRYGNERGVRIGDYSGTSQVFCAHYNEYNNSLNRPEWLARDAAGNPGAYCFGNNDFVDYYINTVVAAAKEFGFKLHCLDFLSIVPCFAADHSHPAGDDSVYHQVMGLVRFMQTLAEVDPEMMIWSNSGNWSEFLPKLAWSNPNLYLTDPFIATPWPGLNMTRLLDDARREQMVSLHYTRFVPYRNFTNCQYFFSQNSIVPDIRNYQYGALSSLAVTPNLCLAEIRPWMDRLPSVQQDEVKVFYATWTNFLREHFALWKTTYHIGDDPAPGNVEIYSHAAGNHGFVFIVNPNYSSETVDMPLDARLGFSGEAPCEIRELHPVDRLLLTSEGPTPALGSTLHVDAPAQQVRVFEIQPAADSTDAPRLYGIPGAIEKTGETYRLRTHGPQGTTHRFALRSADGEPPLASAAVRTDEPKQAKRLYAETPLQLLGHEGPYAYYEITFRRTAAPAELRTWHVAPADRASGESQNWHQGFDTGDPFTFPLEDAPLANFQGAYIHNAFTEGQETLIEFGPAAEPTPSVSDALRATQAPSVIARRLCDEANSLGASPTTVTSVHAIIEEEEQGSSSRTQHFSFSLSPQSSVLSTLFSPFEGGRGGCSSVRKLAVANAGVPASSPQRELGNDSTERNSLAFGGSFKPGAGKLHPLETATPAGFEAVLAAEVAPAPFLPLAPWERGWGEGPFSLAKSLRKASPSRTQHSALSTQHPSWWLRTQFHLPFMYTIGAEPAFDEHTILVFPMRDASRVRELHAWVNGVPLEVRRYAYPRNRALSTYWADLVGAGAHGGDNTLVVHLEFVPN